MTVFSPTALMRVLTTLVDRSLDQPDATPRRYEPRRRKRAHFSRTNASGMRQPQLELVGRGEHDDKLHEVVD